MQTSNKRSLADVENEILATKAELENVHGTETEVYARIVGYYRAVKHWNAGKRDEYEQRKMFLQSENLSPNVNYSSKEAVTYELYTRKTCPNCPPVKDFMTNFEMEGKVIDVDTEDGMAQAAKNGVCASPTVIFYNADGIETNRCHNVDELESVFNIVTEKAKFYAGITI